MLIIEDHAEIVNWMLSRLNTKDHYVHWSSSYSEGIAYLKEKIPDVIILDLQLQDGNGFDILKSVKEAKDNILVYIFSINSAMRSACLRKGADGFFDKNGGGDALVEAVVKKLDAKSPKQEG